MSDRLSVTNAGRVSRSKEIYCFTNDLTTKELRLTDLSDATCARRISHAKVITKVTPNLKFEIESLESEASGEKNAFYSLLSHFRMWVQIDEDSGFLYLTSLSVT